MTNRNGDCFSLLLNSAEGWRMAKDSVRCINCHICMYIHTIQYKGHPYSGVELNSRPRGYIRPCARKGITISRATTSVVVCMVEAASQIVVSNRYNKLRSPVDRTSI